MPNHSSKRDSSTTTSFSTAGGNAEIHETKRADGTTKTTATWTTPDDNAVKAVTNRKPDGSSITTTFTTTPDGNTSREITRSTVDDTNRDKKTSNKWRAPDPTMTRKKQHRHQHLVTRLISIEEQKRQKRQDVKKGREQTSQILQDERRACMEERGRAIR